MSDKRKQETGGSKVKTVLKSARLNEVRSYTFLVPLGFEFARKLQENSILVVSLLLN
jgi:hypothetical protein